MMEDFKKDIDDYFCRFTFGQFVTLILLEVVTLFFVFYLGARYGSDLLGTSEVKKQAVIPGQSPKNVDDIVGTPSVEYTYPEVLTSRDGQKAIRIKPSGVTADEYDRQKIEDPAAIIQRDSPREEAPVQAPTAEVYKKSGSTPSAVPPPTPTTPTVNPPVQERPDEEQLVRQEVPVEAPVEAPVETPKPKGKFTIQVGSYQSSNEASAALRGWKKKGYSAYTAVGTIPDKGTWYRVRIGGFPSREEAQKFLDKFKAKEKASALVVLSNS
ncbi:MAG TPA: SPOR domain-containing protein [bacterium]|nr:SPOR domain-containing protein [bacterium]